MTSPLGPVWMASPPEVHSALLSTGPGPGSLLAAAGAWSSLSTEYASAAAELSGLLGAVQAGAWQGPTAERYMAAHLPYLEWLQQASADSAGVAAQHEVAATAYTAAVAAMPTLAELAANHVVHGVLVATNFFGLNTIPIALNEADYVRMWVQAATTMAGYQAVAGAALASAPRSIPAPNVVNPGIGETGNAAAATTQSGAATQAAQSGSSLNLSDLLSQLLSAYTNFYGGMYQELGSFLQNPIGNSVQLIEAFLTNPSEALVLYGPLLFAIAWQAFSWVGASITYPSLFLSPFLGLVLPLTLPLALANAVEVAPTLTEPVAGGVVVTAQPVSVQPVVALAPTAAPAAGIPASTPAGAGAAATPAPGAATGSFAYVVGGGGNPETGFGPTLTDRGGTKAPAATIPAAAAAVPSAAQSRARRRRRAAMREYGDEYLDMDSDIGVAPDYGQPEQLVSAMASGNGAGTLGFAGTAHREAALQAAGLTKLAGDEYGGGPRMPMLPGTWEQDNHGAEPGRGGSSN
jgi:PPE-repeat protein